MAGALPMVGSQILGYQVVERVQDATTGLLQFFLLPTQEALNYQAGQYVTIRGDSDADQFPFSIASAPRPDGGLKFHIKPGQHNRNLLQTLQPGYPTQITGPFGRMVYQREDTQPLLLLAGGTGIAPFHALIEYALSRAAGPKIRLLWCCKHSVDFYLRQSLSYYAAQFPGRFSMQLLLSQPEPGWQGIVSDFPEYFASIADLSLYRVYASGPQKMVEALEKIYDHKVENEKIFISDWR